MQASSGSRGLAVPAAKRRIGRPRLARPPGTFAERVTLAREARGLTQTQAGRVLGRHLRTIQEWEGRKYVPNALIQEAALARLARK